jgi:hypothetical protein
MSSILLVSMNFSSNSCFSRDRMVFMNW